jgi:hypothetical protein
LGLRSDYYHQLIGYYVLFKIGGLLVKSQEEMRIRKLAIYYSRHGVIYAFDINSVARPADFETFMEWFKVRAREEYPREK